MGNDSQRASERGRKRPAGRWALFALARRAGRLASPFLLLLMASVQVSLGGLSSVAHATAAAAVVERRRRKQLVAFCEGQFVLAQLQLGLGGIISAAAAAAAAALREPPRGSCAESLSSSLSASLSLGCCCCCFCYNNNKRNQHWLERRSAEPN